MSREGIVAAVLALVIAGILIVAALAPGSKTTVVLPAIDLTDVESVPPNEAVVATKYESGGSSILGITIRRSSYLVRVQFFDEPGCALAVSSGEPWPTSHAECVNAVPVDGEIAGMGTTATGESIIGVEFEVSDACYDTLIPGDSWPTAAPSCASAP